MSKTDIQMFVKNTKLKTFNCDDTRICYWHSQLGLKETGDILQWRKDRNDTSVSIALVQSQIGKVKTTVISYSDNPSCSMVITKLI